MVGVVLGVLGLGWLNSLMDFVATVYVRLFQLLAVPTIVLAVSTIFASTYGIGMVLAAPVLFLWQGMFYVVAKISSTAVSDALMAELLIVGGLMITGSGLGLLNLKDCKTLNLLPSLLIPVLWFLFNSLILHA